MKNIKFTYTKTYILIGCMLMTLLGCERELSEEAVFAKFPTTAEIYIDDPVGLTDQFFRSFDPAAGANVNGFGVDSNTFYEGSSSIRIDVPASNDPDGNFIGGIFEDRGAGRNLTGYDALTFWGLGTTSGTVEVGFGTDFDRPETDPSFAVSTVVQMTSGWKKYVVPIPDPSKLIQETGMFFFAAGGFDPLGDGPNGNEIAWTFWIDELKFEKLGTVSQPRPIAFSGQDIAIQTFTGSEINIVAQGLTIKYDVDGENLEVSGAPAYFNFVSSNTDVAIVNQFGIASVIGEGTTEITTELAGVKALGSLAVSSSGALPLAPVPMRPATNVKSIYSDAYTADTGSDFNPGFGGSTTETTEVGAPGELVQIYTNNNFTGIIFDNTVDASTLTHLHVDLYTNEPGTNVNIQIRDIGVNGEIETNIFTGFPDGDDKDKRFTAAGLTVGAWTSVDIPLDGDLATQKNNLGAIILAGGPDFILDNIYFYKE
ncbi:glycosyl hydrolase family 16 [Seonamhaeicola sediminis]|uniref:Glycosyl hydrolase family 16 n=1 Tax=Seonamhaeicola sediminis TaxID=2528206 RepID=A0A562YGU1_9FLAO|nr:glycosyl hydrolase family 16 [Seonamhaeicola sediminis]TWO34032.1 glycosyl hydrolase family 16 [Seonamhaeicola sediminis]